MARRGASQLQCRAIISMSRVNSCLVARTIRSAFIFLVCWSCLAFAHSQPCSASDPAPGLRLHLDGFPLSDPKVWRGPQRCGPNSLYMFLSLSGCEVQYSDLLNQFPSTALPASFLDLKRIAIRYGMKTRVIRVTSDGLQPAVLPAIALVDATRTGVGHFVVIQARDNETLTILDGSTGGLSHRNLADFSQHWDGYLLVDATASQILRTACWCGISIVVAGISWQLSTRQGNSLFFWR